MNTTAPTLSGTADEALTKWRLVKLTGDRNYSHTRPGDAAIGVNEADVADGEPCSVHLLVGRLGSVEVMVDGAVTQNARAYAGLNGKASANALGPCIGYFLEAASADGDVVELLPTPNMNEQAFADSFQIFDDFMVWDSTFGPFVTTADAGATGTTAAIDAVGGQLDVYTDGDDNDEAYIHTIKENFKFAANKPLYFETRCALVEGATNAAAFIIGLLDAAGADALVDTEAGPKASYSGVVFWKVAGSLTLSAEVSIGATQTPITLTGATYVSGTFYKFGILVVPTSSTAMNVYLFINGALVGSATGVTYTGATEMDLIVGAKSNGSAEEKVSIDYILCKQAR
jgi:hypothetical protein